MPLYFASTNNVQNFNQIEGPSFAHSSCEWLKTYTRFSRVLGRTFPRRCPGRGGTSGRWRGTKEGDGHTYGYSWETYGTDRSCRSDRMSPCLRARSRGHSEPTVHPLETDLSWLVFASAGPPCSTFPRSSGRVSPKILLPHGSDSSSRDGRSISTDSPWNGAKRGRPVGTGPVAWGFGRGPTVASGPQQRLWCGLLRAAQFWDSGPRGNRVTALTRAPFLSLSWLICE